MKTRGVLIGLCLVTITAGAAAAQGLSEATQTDRLTIVSVDAVAGTVWCAERSHGLAASSAVVVDREGHKGGLDMLHRGDIIRVRSDEGTIRTIAVMRRASDEIGSPE